MKLRVLLIIGITLLCAGISSRADYIYCTASVSADKTSVCTGETVNITIDSTTCSNGMTVGIGTSYPTNFTAPGIYTISASCSACSNDIGTVFGSDSINIYVGQLAGISPSSATICPGNYMVFTAQSSGTITCGPTWSLSPSSFGSLSTSVGPSTTLTVSNLASGTATLTAVCGPTTETATITAAGTGTFAITSQPTSIVGCVGSSASLTVAATGSDLSYQWLWNGRTLTNATHMSGLAPSATITGATSATLTISNIFATITATNAIPTDRFFGPHTGTIEPGQLYTYQASGCVNVHDLYTADPDGNLYTNADCAASSLFSGPTIATEGFCVGLINYSLVNGHELCIQLGSSGGFQAPTNSGEFYLLPGMNDNSHLDNSGSWDLAVTQTVEGAYSCIVSSSCGLQVSETATLNVSSPCDGIPDRWRIANFGNTNNTGNQCALCTYTAGSDLDNLQDYECGFDPRVAIAIATPASVYSGMWSNTASIPPAGTNVAYSWSVTNGTITGDSNSDTVLWTAGNAGSATLSVTLSGGQSCSTTIYTNLAVTRAYYVDYVGGNDSITNGTNALAPWQHCPGDQSPSLGSGPKNARLNPGDTVFLKGGITYVLTNANSTTWQSSTANVGINLACGTNNAPITYDGSTWGNGSKAIITDNGANGGSNSLAAFENFAGFSNVVIRGFQVGPLGGGALNSESQGDYSQYVNAGNQTGLPPSYAWGVYSAGGWTNVAISNCVFTSIGWWTNAYEVGQASIVGIGITTLAGYNPYLANVTISSNEFTRMHSATEFGVSVATNFVFANNNLHDYLCWGAYFAFANAVAADNIQIYSNSLHDMGWAYFQTYGNYYGVTNTGYHQDPIFLNVSSPCNFGSNINIYANTFSDSHTTNSSAATGQIFLSGGPSANIYNNLFNLQTPSSVGGSGFITDNDGQENATTLTCNMFNPTLVRILNNTFISDKTPTWLWMGGGGSYNGVNAWWPTNHMVQILNNIGYCFDTNSADAGSTTMLLLGTIGNTNVFQTLWTVDYNDWYVNPNLDSWFDVTAASANSGTFSLMKAYGFEQHGTNLNPQFVDVSHGPYQNADLNNYNLGTLSPCVTGSTNLSTLGLPGLNSSHQGAY